MKIMIRKFAFAFALVFCLSTASCGFEPMYGVNRNTPVGAEENLARIEIGNIPNREGQYLRNALIDRFYRSGRPLAPSYILNVRQIRETLINLDITKDADTTRGQLRLETEMRLSDKKTGALLLKRDLRSITSYNILASEFATRVTEENSRTNALDDLARQIELQTVLYFKR
jgi:LPS-assembly lipoprotein